MLVLADAPGPSGNVDAHASTFNHNQQPCFGNTETPPLSGIGIAIVGGNDVRLDGNTIQGNLSGLPDPSVSPFPSAGVVIISGSGGTPPTNIAIHGNHMGGNTQDFASDGSGINVQTNGNH
jgi:hypothetical protein